MVAGLGNPGQEYANTPHNVGFDVVDMLAEKFGSGWKNSSKFHAQTLRAAFAGEPLLLVKPQTFMNLSGTSIGPLLSYFGGTPGDLVVVSDDVNLPLGKLRIRGGGSNGGHNGLGNVIQCLGTDAFARVRLGVGRREVGSLIDHVLGKFDAERRTVVQTMEQTASEAVLVLLEKGLNEAMNRFNGWSADEAPATEDRK